MTGHSRYAEAEPYVTRDGSLIRELMHPAVHGNAGASLAEAVVEPGQTTHPHRHRIAEELYHVTRGVGELTLGAERICVAPGDTALIPPGTVHSITNTGDGPLHILCVCTPAYRHEDTELV